MEHEHVAHVAAPAQRVYEVLSDVENLPRYVPQLTAARPREGDVVEVEARYEGRTQHGEASFDHDDATRTIRWSSAGGYAGSLRVDDDAGGGARLTLHLHTTHDEDSDPDVAATLDAMRRLVEAEL